MLLNVMLDIRLGFGFIAFIKAVNNQYKCFIGMKLYMICIKTFQASGTGIRHTQWRMVYCSPVYTTENFWHGSQKRA